MHLIVGAGYVSSMVVQQEVDNGLGRAAGVEVDTKRRDAADLSHDTEGFFTGNAPISCDQWVGLLFVMVAGNEKNMSLYLDATETM